MGMKKSMLIWTVIAVVVLGAALWGPIVSNVEQAKYSVADKVGNIEIRDYAPMLVAEVEVAGDREEAINQGFRMIADYIFGNNASVQKVAMTAPVIQQKSENIAMTAPVMQQGNDNTWKVRFVMPDSYTKETLPKPNSTAVKIKPVSGKRFAVVRFSGMAGEKSLERRLKELDSFNSKRNFKTIATPVYAFYNPPWTLPFLRRNEIMIEIAR